MKLSENSNNNKSRYTGFTLAEVLITLAVLGVVAAMTVPSIMVNIDDNKYAAQVKEANANIRAAFQHARTDYISHTDLFPLGESVSGKEALDTLSNYLAITKKCYGNDRSCMNYMTYYGNDVATSSGFSKKWANLGTSSLSTARLNNGMNIAIRNYSITSSCYYEYQGNKDSDGDGFTDTPYNAISNMCGALYVDVNGAKKPNTRGKDIFVFIINKESISSNGINTSSSWGSDGNSIDSYMIDF